MRAELTGKRFGRLVVEGYDHTAGKTAVWKCRCDCGNTAYVRTYNLTNGNTQSCGCYHRDQSRKYGAISNLKHGKSYSRIYHIHRGMIDRCYLTKHDSYPNYGGRGITICSEWYTPGVKGNPGFLAFYNWSMENGYSDELSIDRKDVNGPYAPWNCRWVTFDVQINNKSTNRLINDGIDTLTWAQMARKYNAPSHFVKVRVHYGWSLDAVVHALHHPELGLTIKRGQYYDKDGFVVLVPKYGNDSNDR